MDVAQLENEWRHQLYRVGDLGEKVVMDGLVVGLAWRRTAVSFPLIAPDRPGSASNFDLDGHS